MVHVKYSTLYAYLRPEVLFVKQKKKKKKKWQEKKLNSLRNHIKSELKFLFVFQLFIYHKVILTVP